MDYDKLKSDLKDSLMLFKEDMFRSKKYLLIYMVLLVLLTISRLEMGNYMHPKMEIFAFILLSVMGIFSITYYMGHNEDKELYKTAFIIILIFGIVFSFVSPICIGPDEVEHFVRAEMTSRGVLFPEYVNGSFQTIQSTLDLIEVGKVSIGPFDFMEGINSTIFNTTADTQPINHTLVNYPNAFAQNPFYGYLAPAIGMFLAKLFNMNAIWLLWLGRIFNTLLYATLVSIGIKKTPILKTPVLAFACIPFVILLGATVSIDVIINGLSILAICYFFYLYKCPKINHKHIIKYSLLVMLLGTCKITCFSFIILLLFLPKENFSEKKYYLYGFLAIIVAAIVGFLWIKYYANPGFFKSGFRVFYCKWESVNSTEQIHFMLTHKKYTIMEMIQVLNYFSPMLIINDVGFNLMDLLFLGGVAFMYPAEKFNLKSRIGALLAGILIYYGTYIVFLLSWTPVGKIGAIQGVQLRYFIPAFALLPFIFGFNKMDGDKYNLDKYIVVLTIAFIAFRIMEAVVQLY